MKLDRKFDDGLGEENVIYIPSRHNNRKPLPGGGLLFKQYHRRFIDRRLQ
jgi:hypothetical protein